MAEGSLFHDRQLFRLTADNLVARYPVVVATQWVIRVDESPSVARHDWGTTSISKSPGAVGALDFLPEDLGVSTETPCMSPANEKVLPGLVDLPRLRLHRSLTRSTPRIAP